MQSPEDLIRAAVRPTRWARMQVVLQQRLGAVRMVLEHVHHPHNVSAVLRSCEAFGVQYVHAVDTADGLALSRRITMGTHKWLTLSRHDVFAQCAAELRAAGCRLYAATLDPGAVALDQIPVDRPVALVLGNERRGVTAEALDLCDGFYTIPMAGFAQSLNISVAAAVSLYDLTRRIRAARPDHGLLTDSERQDLLAAWLPKSVRCGKRILRATRHGAPACVDQPAGTSEVRGPGFAGSE